MRTRAFLTGVVLVVLLVAGIAPALAQDGTGTLEFYANGEDFIRQGFESKDGWQIVFDGVYVSLAEVVAYQAALAYDAELGGEVDADQLVELEGVYVVDLAEGDEDAALVFVDEYSEAPAGHYNAISWRMVNSEDNDGYTLVIAGVAEKDDTAIEFTINVEAEYEYYCGEYVGDTRKGILDPDDYAELEMTFHFDHIFGDGTLPPDDELNELAPGFDVFAALAEDGYLEVDLADLEAALAPEDYQMLVDVLPTLGHVGEGHCYEVSQDEEHALPDDAVEGAVG